MTYADVGFESTDPEPASPEAAEFDIVRIPFGAVLVWGVEGLVNRLGAEEMIFGNENAMEKVDFDDPVEINTC